MQIPKFLLFIGLAFLLVEACRVDPASFLGDVSVDLAVEFKNQGVIHLGSHRVAGGGFSFHAELFSRSDSGCIFSAGEVGTPKYMEAKIVGRELHVTMGATTVASFKQYTPNRWVKLAFTMDAKDNSVEFNLDNEHFAFTTDVLSTGIPVGNRDFHLGWCKSDNTHFDGYMDNFILWNRALSRQDIVDLNVQYFPMTSSKNVIALYSFNDVHKEVDQMFYTVGLSGDDNDKDAKAQLYLATSVDKAVAGTSQSGILDTYCVQYHAVPLDGTTPPFFGTTSGGVTQMVNCLAPESFFSGAEDPRRIQQFVVNNRWSPDGGVTQVTVKTSKWHYWRITAGGLKVEHRIWGGWTTIPRSAAFLAADQSTYRFTDDEVVIQSGVYGYVRISESEGVLNIESGMDTTKCPLDEGRQKYCDFREIAETIYDFSQEPVPEAPMGDLPDQPGVSGQPPTLACPPITLQYHPEWIPKPVYPGPAVAKTPFDPCSKRTSTEIGRFTTECGKYYAAGTDANTVCIKNACVFGQTPKPVKTECFAQHMISKANPEYTPDADCVQMYRCPGDCNGHGTCVSGSCVCDAGFVGVDCIVENYDKFFHTTVGPKPIQYVPIRVGKVNALTSTHFAYYANKLNVRDGITIFLLKNEQTTAPFTGSYHLIITANDGTSYNYGNQVATITVTSSVDFPVNSQMMGYSSTMSGPTAASRNIVLTWSSGIIAYGVITDIPAGDLTFSVSSASASQLFIASADHTYRTWNYGNTAMAQIRMSKLPASKWSNFQITGGEAKDVCRAVTDCAACVAKPECGWCHWGVCVPGNEVGPLRGVCGTYSYTFDTTTSRRVQQWITSPVSTESAFPVRNDVVMKVQSNSDLPLEIVAGVDTPNGIVYDFNVIVGTQIAQNNYANNVISMLSVAQSFPNSGIAAGYITTTSYAASVGIRNPRDLYYFPLSTSGYYYGSCGGVCAATGGGVWRQTSTGTCYPVYQALNYYLSGNFFGNRANARRIYIFAVDLPACAAPSQAYVDNIRANLFSQGAFVYFDVMYSAHLASYQNVVGDSNLAFGDAGVQQPSWYVFYPATRAAAGESLYAYFDNAANLHTDVLNSKDHYYTSRLSYYPQMYGRFTIPMAGDNENVDTTLYVAGKGKQVVKVVPGSSTPGSIPEQPVAFVSETQIELEEDEEYVLQVAAKTFRNTRPSVAYVTEYTLNGVSGQPHIYQAGIQNGDVDGKITVVAANAIADASNPVAATDRLNRFVIKAPQQLAGSDVSSFKVYAHDTCMASAMINVNVRVLQANRPPRAESLPMVADEDVALTVKFGYFDENPTDTHKVILTMPPHSMDADDQPVYNVGKFYKYHPSCTASRAVAEANSVDCPELKMGDEVPQDPVYKVAQAIYWAPAHKNSEADPVMLPHHVAKPCFNYKVVETNTPQLYSSAEIRVPIDIRAVNDAPFTINDPLMAESDFSFTWANMDDACHTDCTFVEDFGEQWSNDVQEKIIYLGGVDIEMTDLTAQITDIDCDPSATLYWELRGPAEPLKIGDVVKGLKSGVVAPALRFKPGFDTNSNTANRGGHYCKISYRVVDQHGTMSTNTHTVTINITPVSDLPRLMNPTQTMTVLEQLPQEIKLDITDPEGQSYTVFGVGCKDATLGDKIFICQDGAPCQDRQEVTCADMMDPQNPVQFNFNDAPYMIYISGPLDANSEETNYQTIRFKILDSQSRSALASATDAYMLIINAVQMNSYPEVTVDGEVVAKTKAVSLASGSVYTPVVSVHDADIEAGDFIVTLSFEPKDGSYFTIDETAIPRSRVVSNSFDETGKFNGQVDLEFQARESQTNSVLSGFSFHPAADAVYTIRIKVSDQGNSGMCPFGQDGNPLAGFDSNDFDINKVCALVADVAIQAEFVGDNSKNTIAIASASAGVFAVGLIAAVAAARFFNRKAEDSYNPWGVFNESDAVLNSPLYESGEFGGSSQVYTDTAGNDADAQYHLASL